MIELPPTECRQRIAWLRSKLGAKDGVFADWLWSDLIRGRRGENGVWLSPRHARALRAEIGDAPWLAWYLSGRDEQLIEAAVSRYIGVEK